MSAPRAEARRSLDRGICSRSPVVLQRHVPYGKRKSECRFEFSVFGESQEFGTEPQNLAPGTAERRPDGTETLLAF
jgi:hypothetical protein